MIRSVVCSSIAFSLIGIATAQNSAPGTESGKATPVERLANETVQPRNITNQLSEQKDVRQPKLVGKATTTEPLVIKVESFPVAKEFDLGQLRPGKSYVIPVRIHNRTGHTIKVSEVNTSCGCMVASKRRPEPLPGGGAGDLLMNFTAPIRVGKFGKNFRIAFSGRGDDIASVTIKGHISSPIEIDQKTSLVELGADGQGVIFLKQRPGVKWTPVSIRALQTGVKCNELVSVSGGRWRSEVRAPISDHLVDSVPDILRITLRSEESAKEIDRVPIVVDVPVQFQFPRRLRVVPDLVFADSKGVCRVVLIGFSGNNDNISLKPSTKLDPPVLASVRKISNGALLTIKAPKSYAKQRKPIDIRVGLGKKFDALTNFRMDVSGFGN